MAAKDPLDLWLNTQTETAEEQVKESSKLGKNWDKGTYTVQLVTLLMKLDKDNNPGVLSQFICLDEGDYYGETLTWWHSLTRENAWTWFGKFLMDLSTETIDPAEVIPTVRKTKEDIYGLVNKRTCCKLQVYVSKDKNDPKIEYFNNRILKNIDPDVLEAMDIKLFDPEKLKKDRENRKANSGKGKEEAKKPEPKKPEPKKEEPKKPADYEPFKEETKEAATEDDGVDIEVGTRLKFTLTEVKGANKKVREVIGAVTEIDEPNGVLKITETDGTVHEIKHTEIDEVLGGDTEVV